MAETHALRTTQAASHNSSRVIWTLSWEWVFYAALAVLAFALFANALDGIPMRADEASQALIAWRFVDVTAPGTHDLVPWSPLVFLAQSGAFGLLGGGEGYARIGTALAGVALVLAPALLRSSLGSTRALLLSSLLACSPVVLITARSSSPMVWATLLALLTLWAGGRYWATRTRGWGIAALVFLAMLMLMTDPGGLLIGVTLLVATLLTWLGGTDQEDDEELPTAGQRLARSLGGFPWALGAGTAALVIIAFSTLFLTHSSGLTAVGDLLLRTVGGFTQRLPDTTAFYPMLTSIFYEPWLWLLGVAAAIWLSRGDNPAPTFLDRFALTWLALNGVLSLLFIGARADHALWLTLPLALVVSRLALAIFAKDADTPGWAQWLIGGLALGLLAMGSLAFQSAARSLGRIDFTSATWVQQFDPLGMVILFIVLAFFVVGYFLVRSFWESDRLPQRALAVALLAFSAFTGIGGGWRSAVTEVDNPVDFWQRGAPSHDLMLLRETLMELAERQTRGYPEMPITVISSGDPQIEWTVRDFSAARFVSDYDEVGNATVLLALAMSDFDRTPPLEGNYVGQDFTLSRTWTLDNLRAQDVPQWWSQHRTLNAFAALPRQAILWVRTDLYAGTIAR